MNQSEERLTSAFRDWAAEAPQGAPAEVGRQLKDSFRKHHVRRRRARLLAALALGGCLAIVAVSALKETGLISRRNSDRPMAGTPGGVEPREEPSSPGSNKSGPSGPAQPKQPPPRVLLAHKPRNKSTDPGIARGFTPLPTYDPALGVRGYEIVRVGLEDTALSQLGLPVHENASGQRVVADLLLDKDGLPLAVRFVGWQKTQ